MDEKKEKPYLSEDEDLLHEIEAVGPSTSGVAEAEKMHKLIIIQIKATLRNKKVTRDLDVSTTRFSIVLASFAFVQVILGIYGFMFSAETSTHPYIGMFYIVIVGILIYVIYREISKLLADKKTD